MVANEKRWSIRNNSDKSWHYLIQKYVIIDSNFKFQPLFDLVQSKNANLNKLRE